MRSRFLLIVVVWLLPSIALAQLAARLGPRGEIAEIRLGKTVYFTDVAVSLVKPDWAGNIVDQRAAEPAAVRIEKSGKVTTYRYTLQGEGVQVRVQERVDIDDKSVALQYEIVPVQDVLTETVVLRGLMPAETHAGVTHYVVGDVNSSGGLCPAALNRDAYVIYNGAAEWIGFAPRGALALRDGDKMGTGSAAPSVGPREPRPSEVPVPILSQALRVVPQDLALQFQDDRKWNTPGFSLLATTRGGKLPAGKPIRFAISFRADTAEQLAADARRMRQGDLAGMKLTDERPLSIDAMRLDRPSVPVYSPIELSADIAANYANPFDAGQIAVDAEINPPTGIAVMVPGFYYAPMRCWSPGFSRSEKPPEDGTPTAERLRLAAPPGFRVRYTPVVQGKHRLVLHVTDRSGTVRSRPIEFTATAGDSPGFVRVARRSPRYFAFDNGRPYFAVGENMCWAGGRTPLADYSAWLKGLGGGGGGNWARLWLAYNEKGLEWMPAPTPKPGTGTYQGLGKYALDNAWRLDEIVRMSRENGVYLMFCLGTYGEFTDGGYFNEGCWISNPYNVKNGGPCAKPADFWTNPQAKKLYKQRLRYLVARWGYSPNLFAWEFWNEVPATPTGDDWVAEMAAYLKHCDPNRHLVSTTYGSSMVWRCQDVDFAMNHLYGQAGNVADFTPQIQNEVRAATSFGKPFLLAEFGIDWQTDDGHWDPHGTGLNMHNGAWAAVMSGAAGTAMLWYWDGYVHPKNVYHTLTPVRKFADTVDWSETPLRPLAGIAVETDRSQPETFRDLTVPATMEWVATPSNRYTVLRSGELRGGPVAMTLGSPQRGNPGELPSQLTWRLDMPKAGKVVARLGQVCSRARLRITLDKRVKLDRALAAGGPGKGPWKAAHRLEQFKVWVSDYDEEIAIDVPAGRHELTFANTEGDWLQIRSLFLPAYRSSRYPDVNALGLESDKLLLVWLHNRQSTWRTEFDGKRPEPQKSLRVTVRAPADGTWHVQWWDTFTGEILRRDQVQVAAGRLTLVPPHFTRDLAVRVEKGE